MVLEKTRNLYCQYVPCLLDGRPGFLAKRRQVIIKDIRLVPAKDPPILKLVNIFWEKSLICIVAKFVRIYLLFMVLYSNPMSYCKVC